MRHVLVCMYFCTRINNVCLYTRRLYIRGTKEIDIEAYVQNTIYYG